MRHFKASVAVGFLLIAGAVVAGNGAVPVGAGGGSIRGAFFNSGTEGDATFSFFAGYDKHGESTGSFMMKRVYPGKGVRLVVSTEVTDVEVGSDDVCPYVKMAGRTALHAGWVDYPQERREYFFLQAWDCDGIEGFEDMVWFGVYRNLGDPAKDPDGDPNSYWPNDRPALTLFRAEVPEPPEFEPDLEDFLGEDLVPAELTHGNINIHY